MENIYTDESDIKAFICWRRWTFHKDQLIVIKSIIMHVNFFALYA